MADDELFDEADLNSGEAEPDFGDDPPVGIPDVPASPRHANKFEAMSDAEIRAVANRAVQGGSLEGDHGEGRYGEMSDQQFAAALDDVKRLAAEPRSPSDYAGQAPLDDASDPGGYLRWARRGLEGYRAGLQGDLAIAVRDGTMSLEDAVEAQALGESGGLEEVDRMAELSDEQFEELLGHVKAGSVPTGTGPDRGTFARQAAEWLTPESVEEPN